MNTKTTVLKLRWNIKILWDSRLDSRVNEWVKKRATCIGKTPKSNGKPKRATRAREFLKRTLVMEEKAARRMNEEKKKGKRKHIGWHTFRVLEPVSMQVNSKGNSIFIMHRRLSILDVSDKRENIFILFYQNARVEIRKIPKVIREESLATMLESINQQADLQIPSICNDLIEHLCFFYLMKFITVRW